jgi:hypothetical protein
LVASLPVEERLRHYFLAMGGQVSAPLENAPSGLTVCIGHEKIHVAILESDTLLERGKIIETVICLAILRGSVDQLYLAAPRLLGTTVDAEVFRSHGIGLLLFDDRRIDEAVTAQSFRDRNTQRVEQLNYPNLPAEVATLRSMYAEMERTIAKLREEVKSYHESITLATAIPENRPTQHFSHRETTFTEPEGGLPSFFVNNPWLEVLSKRGREEGPPIAA